MDSEGLGMKLLPKSLAAKRRRKKQAERREAEAAAELEAQAAGDAETVALKEDISRMLTGRETFVIDSDDGTNSTTMAEDEEEGNNSQVSYDSDPESTARPTTISTHPSQIGYLTTSSPIVQATHLPETQSMDDALPQLSSRSTTTTPRAKRAESLESDTRSRSSRSQTSLNPPQNEVRRSPSPVGRIRQVFKSKKSLTSLKSRDSASPSPERKPRGDDTSPSADVAASAKPKSDPPAQEPDAPKVTLSERRRSRASTTTRIDTSIPPQTPPSSEKATPVIVNTPPTPTDHSYQGGPPSPVKRTSTDAANGFSNSNGGSPRSNMISQRRSRAGSAGPSKLSNITLAPLTPTPENGPLGSPSANAAAGFFSSMISAAQNAANQLSNTIQTTGIGQTGNKPRSIAPKDQSVHDQDQVEVEPAAEPSSEAAMEKELAVKTLGTGELSLSQLGISEPGSTAATPLTARFPESSDARARSESAPVESSSIVGNGESASEESRPRSLYEPTSTGDRSPPTASLNDGGSGIQRTSSIRSAIGRRRNRGSSAATGTTGTTIGAAIAAANASITHPHANSSAPKLTGFAVASKKRNRDFHNLFKSVPDDDYLIEDYSCALQREILAHGRLYVSEGHLCFSSNILGWATTLVISFDEIVSVEKRSTALVFKNGLMISTLHAKHIFASFTSRDSTYDLIVNIWKLGHPTLRSSLNGVQLDGTGGDKTEKVEEGDINPTEPEDHSASGSDDDSGDGDDDVYDEDDDEDELPETTQPTELTSGEVETDKAVSRKPSGAVGINGALIEQPKDIAPAASGAPDFPGPTTHAPTDCGDSATHYERIVGDDVIPAPIGKVYNLLFGPASVTWMSKWLTIEAKCTDLQMEDKKGLSPDNKSRSYSYIKPLNASIGPRQTKCMVTETLDNFDLEKSVNLSVTTQNPDVPSGNVFSVKTKYCLSWAENNSTRVQVNCTIEWTGKSWLKGPIEKGANDGQTSYCKDIFASLKAAVSSRPRSANASNGAVVKGKKKGRRGKASHSATDVEDEKRAPKHAQKQDWGLLEPVHGLLEPIVDIIKPILTGNVMYGLLVGLLVATWFGFGFTNRQTAAPYGADLGFYGYPDRVAAYEEMWRQKEGELLEWLEERVGLDRLNDESLPIRKKAVEPRSVEEKMREERMDQREIEQAIRVNEEKLKVLKGVLDKKKASGKSVPKQPAGEIPTEGRSES